MSNSGGVDERPADYPKHRPRCFKLYAGQLTYEKSFLASNSSLSLDKEEFGVCRIGFPAARPRHVNYGLDTMKHIHCVKVSKYMKNIKKKSLSREYD